MLLPIGLKTKRMKIDAENFIMSINELAADLILDDLTIEYTKSGLYRFDVFVCIFCSSNSPRRGSDYCMIFIL